MIVNNIGFRPYQNVKFSGLSNVNILSTKDKNESTKIVSLKDADNLKYDVEYNRLSRFKTDTNIVGENIDIYFKNWLSGSKVMGTAYNHVINLEYTSTGFNPNKMNIKGKIDTDEISLTYNILGNNVKIEGDISAIDDKTLTLMNMLARDYSEVTTNQMNIAAMLIF